MIEQARGGEVRAANWQGTGQVMAGTLALGIAWLLSMVGIFYASPLQALMGLVFHPRRRDLGLSVSYSVGVAIFGGFAPFITTWMITLTGDARSPGLYLTATGMITILA